MDAQIYEGGALNYILVQPDGFSREAGYPLAVLLHGFGASMYDLAGLSPAIGDYIFAFPNAPYAMEIMPGSIGYSWTADRPGVQQPLPDTAPLNDKLDAFFAELIDQVGVEPGRIAIGGFSQGAGVALNYGLLHPDTFAGIFVLSGAFRESAGLRDHLPADRNQRIFIAHGTLDPMVPLERGLATKTTLEELGYAPVYNLYDMAHEVAANEVTDLAAWLRETLPPPGAGF